MVLGYAANLSSHRIEHLHTGTLTDQYPHDHRHPHLNADPYQYAVVVADPHANQDALALPYTYAHKNADSQQDAHNDTHTRPSISTMMLSVL